MRDDVWRVQIKHTVKKHLDKELQLRNRGHQGPEPVLHRPRGQLPRLRRAGQPVKGKFANAFEAALAALRKDARYSVLEWTQAADRAAAQRLFRRRTRRASSRTPRATPRPTTRFTT